VHTHPVAERETRGRLPLNKYEGKGGAFRACICIRARGMHANATCHTNHRGIMRMTSAGCTRNDMSACAAMHRYLQR